MMGDYGMEAGMVVVGLFWLVLVIGLGLLVFVLVRLFSGRSIGGPDAGARATARPSSGRAREILAERYARGEIATEEYRERLAGLDESER